MRRLLSRGLMSAAGEESLIEVATRGSCMTLLLARPKALNALNQPMIRQLYAAYEKGAADPSVKCILLEGAGGKAFCAGGDVKGICLAGQNPQPVTDGELPITDAFFREEYALNAAIAGCPKPQVAVWDGIVMGGGVGLSVHGTHRVATERAMFAMPETNIGLFPDVGGSHFLSRLPGELGTYIGLSGARLNAADLLYCGLATHHVPSAALPELQSALGTCASAGDVEATLKRLSLAAPSELSCNLKEKREAIDAAFAFDSVEEILGKLDQMSAGGSAFASETLETLRKMSPTSMKLTLRLVREARASAGAPAPLTACLTREFRVVQRCVTICKPLGSDDFFEGIRAALIDKDRAPKWSPPTIEEVSDASVDAYFEPLGDKELNVPTLPGFEAP